MDLTYKQDHMYIDGEAVNIPNAAAVYAGLLVEGIQRSMEYSPRFQREFWELMRPSDAAYYDWRITPSELVAAGGTAQLRDVSRATVRIVLAPCFKIFAALRANPGISHVALLRRSDNIKLKVARRVDAQADAGWMRPCLGIYL